MKITDPMRDAAKQNGFSLYEDTSPEAPLAAVGQRKDLTPELKRVEVPTKEQAQMTLEKLLGEDHIAMPSPQFSLAKAVEALPAETATPRQWLSTLASAEAKTGGPLEKVMGKSLSRRSFLSGAAKMPMVLRNLRGISDWLSSQQGLLSKQQVLEHIAPQIPKLKVIERKGLFNYDDVNTHASQMMEKDGYTADKTHWYDPEGDHMEADHQQEVHDEYLDAAEAELRKKHVGNEEGDSHDLDYHYLPGEKPDSLRHVMLQYELPIDKSGSINQVAARSSDPRNVFHGSSDEPNILAEYRTSDRDVAGANTLHGESFSSEWHEKGQEKGYGAPDMSQWRVKDKSPITPRYGGPEHWNIVDGKGNSIMSMPEREYPTAQAALQGAKEHKSRGGAPTTVPDAPLKDNWHEVAFDHFLKKAVDEGYDAVSWTPEISPSNDVIGERFVKSREQIWAEVRERHPEWLDPIGIVKSKYLDDFMKETEELRKKKPELDKIDDFANKVADKYGAKVEDKHLQYPELYEGLYEDDPDFKEPAPVRFMRITPEMRDAAKKGVSFFADESPLAPLAAEANQKRKPLSNEQPRSFTPEISGHEDIIEKSPPKGPIRKAGTHPDYLKNKAYRLRMKLSTQKPFGSLAPVGRNDNGQP